jgi:hypothetical protein
MARPLLPRRGTRIADDAGVSFYVRHRYGGNDRDPPLESLDALQDEVDQDPLDEEHIR